MFDHTILLAHGSRDPQWAKPFFELEQQLSGTHEAVSLAFMELAAPSIEEAVAGARQRGARSIAILPLFLSTGRHLKTDVPEIIAPLKDKLDVEIQLLPAIGEQEEFRAMLTGLVGKLLSQQTEY